MHFPLASNCENREWKMQFNINSTCLKNICTNLIFLCFSHVFILNTNSLKLWSNCPTYQVSGYFLDLFYKNWQSQPINNFSHKLWEIAKLFSNCIKNWALKRMQYPRLVPKNCWNPPWSRKKCSKVHRLQQQDWGKNILLKKKAFFGHLRVARLKSLFFWTN